MWHLVIVGSWRLRRPGKTRPIKPLRHCDLLIVLHGVSQVLCGLTPRRRRPRMDRREDQVLVEQELHLRRPGNRSAIDRDVNDQQYELTCTDGMRDIRTRRAAEI